MAHFLAFFTLFHLSLTFCRLEVPFKTSVSVTYYTEMMTTQVTFEQKYFLFYYIPILNNSSLVLFISGSLLLFCIRNQAWGSLLRPTVIVLQASQMQNVLNGLSVSV